MHTWTVTDVVSGMDKVMAARGEPSCDGDEALFNRDPPSEEPIKADDVQVGGRHYKELTIQPWEAMEAWSTREEFLGHLRLTALKYIGRAGRKGPASEDIEKAIHYLQKWVETDKKVT